MNRSERYYVEVRDSEYSAYDAQMTGFLQSDGRLVVEFDRDFPRGTALTAQELVDDAIVVVSYESGRRAAQRRAAQVHRRPR